MNNTKIERLMVPLPGREYPILIGRGVLEEADALLPSLLDGENTFIVTDSNVGPLYLGRLMGALARAGMRVGSATIAAGEGNKSLESAGRLWGQLAEFNIGRRDAVVALGGGVVGDVAGFVAATWLRGVAFVQCATTVEAAVDASVGGKTAINLKAGKNLVGAFHQPRAVLIDVETFRTLDERDLRAGLAESVKHALIADGDFLTWHEQHAAEIVNRDNTKMIELVRRNCEIKADVVAADERETGGADGIGRAALNLGHTLGHALEAHFDFTLRHGECVGLGLLAALRIGTARGVTRGDLATRVERLLGGLGLPTRMPPAVEAAELRPLLARDKKAAAGRTRWLLLAEPGRLKWADDISEDELRAVLAGLAAGSA